MPRCNSPWAEMLPPWSAAPDVEPTAHAQILTLNLGTLVIHTTYVGIRGRRISSDYRSGAAADQTVQVWPLSKSPATSWPPPRVLSVADLVGLTGGALTHLLDATAPEADEPTSAV
jgi:hypothetical protein